MPGHRGDVGVAAHGHRYTDNTDTATRHTDTAKLITQLPPRGTRIPPHSARIPVAADDACIKYHTQCIALALVCLLTVSSSTVDGPAGTLYWPGAAGLFLCYCDTDRATSRTMGCATTSQTIGCASSWAGGTMVQLSAQLCTIVPLDLQVCRRRGLDGGCKGLKRDSTHAIGDEDPVGSPDSLVWCCRRLVCSNLLTVPSARS